MSSVKFAEGERVHNDRRFLKVLHYFSVHNITWQPLPEGVRQLEFHLEVLSWLSRNDAHEVFFQALVACS